MALKHRVALGVALLMVLVLVAILPPRTCSEVEQWDIAATALCSGTRYPWGRTHGQAIDRARNGLTRRLRELQLADSMRALATAGRSVRSADGTVVVLHEASLTADSARVWLALALAERDRIAPGRPRARIVLALDSRLAWERRSVPGQPRYAGFAGPQARRFTSASGRDTTCFVMLRLSRASRYDAELVERDDHGSFGAFLGSCGLVGRFGAAGTAALEATRYAFHSDRSAYPQRRSTMVSGSPGELRPIDRADYRLTGCAKGETEACASLVGLGGESDAWRGYVRGLFISRDFLSYLREVEGPDKFQRFWQSPLGGERALADAFGRPAVETVRAWAQHDFSLPGQDPAGVGAMALAAIGWLGAALAAAIAIGKYRQASA